MNFEEAKDQFRDIWDAATEQGYNDCLDTVYEYLMETYLLYYGEKMFPKRDFPKELISGGYTKEDGTLDWDRIKTNWSGNVMRDMIPRIAVSIKEKCALERSSADRDAGEAWDRLRGEIQRER